jgi:hypothetical protein
VKDRCGVREEYILEYDDQVIRKADLKQKNSKENNDDGKMPKLGQNLFMIKEDEDLWDEKALVQAQIEKNIKNLGSKASKSAKFKNKVQKLNIHKSNKTKATNYEFLMTSFMSIGLNAQKGMKKELKNNKKSVKTSKRALFKGHKTCETNLIDKVEIFRGLENLTNVPSNIFQSCMNGSKKSQDFCNSLSRNSRKRLEQLIDSYKRRLKEQTNDPESPVYGQEFDWDSLETRKIDWKVMAKTIF